MFTSIQFVPIVILLVIVVAVVVRNVRVVPQAKAYVIERLGAYSGTWQVGLHFKIPIIDRIANRVSLKENVLDFPPQPVITKDNVTMEIDTVIYYQVTDPKLYTYGVEYPLAAIENLTATTLRNIIGDLELDESLTSREHINARMREVLDEATDSWGIKINRVEVKNITPPRDILSAMEKQMRAERERRESILRAEGEKRSSILIAEGNKQAQILEAEARKASTILEAEATKEMQILEATGESEAIRLVQLATADGIRMIVESAPTEQVIAIKSLEAFEKAADGRATKIIIPSSIQGLAGLATSVSELVQNDPGKAKVSAGPELKGHSAP
ncbi:MAG: paraslipin [Clostridiales Family XIII bacterium]|jgi:regulator of protease activity HflC (stomatin/prohibitin superfamily)|nr:paraslipin [Clostridiales Family XIII bacterium]